ncbi:MAG TPA: hypothetical protein VGE45_03475 [Chloroflexia bacterium]|jgi:hypothetical protein
MDTESGEMYPTLMGNCDFSEIPLRIISDDGRPITGQPVITALIDSFSGAVIGTHVHIEGLDAEQAQGKE